MSVSYKVKEQIAPEHIELIRQGKYRLEIDNHPQLEFVDREGYLDAEPDSGTAFILAQTIERGRKIGLLNGCLRFERGTPPIYGHRLKVILDVSASSAWEDSMICRPTSPLLDWEILEDSASNNNHLMGRVLGRVTELEMQLERLFSRLPEEQTKVDSGTWSTPYLPPDQTDERINFSKTFKSAPTVTASISTADLDKNENFRLRVWVTDVDSKGFTIHAAVWAGTKLYQCVVSWIAVGN
ncbi:hypothetical protein V8E54_014417 [Elaphomyces granulatus]